MKLSRVISLALVAMLLTLVVPVSLGQGELGTPENPIQVLFVPSVDAAVIVSGGEIMAQALNEATGLHFEVAVPTSYAATIEEICASPSNTMAFIPARAYVEANNLCGVEVEAAAIRNGWSVYWAQYIVRRDSDIYTFGDLAGKTWGAPSLTSTSGYTYPLAELTAAGITPGETVETGGHGQTVLAVYNGEVDFGTTYFSPALTPGAPWSIGDLPEPYDLTVDDVDASAAGLFVGAVEVLDARALARETAPDILQQVRILRLSAPIPNDTLSFGPDFPDALRDEIVQALIDFSTTEAWAQSIGSSDFYGWSSLEPTTDSAYDPIRLLIAFEESRR